MISIGGNPYFVFFIDDYSRRCWVYTIRHKGEVLELFVEWKRNMKKNTRRKIKILRSDNGGEYTCDSFLQLWRNYIIERHFTVRKTLQQNSVVERMNKTLLEKVCCMLSNIALLKSFWAEALAYAFHLVNRLPSSAIWGKTPLKVWLKKSCSGLWFVLGIRLSGLLSCQERQVGSNSEEMSVRRIQERHKRLHNLKSKRQEV